MRNKQSFLHIQATPVVDLPVLASELFRSELWDEPRRYSRFEALIDLCWNLKEFKANIQDLGDRWGWSRITVHRFLERIRSEALITKEFCHVRTATTVRRMPVDWLATRLRIFERDGYVCQYCGNVGLKLECDHVIPVSRGGSDEDDNLLTACQHCNRSKTDKLPSEWRPS